MCVTEVYRIVVWDMVNPFDTYEICSSEAEANDKRLWLYYNDYIKILNEQELTSQEQKSRHWFMCIAIDDFRSNIIKRKYRHAEYSIAHFNDVLNPPKRYYVLHY